MKERVAKVLFGWMHGHERWDDAKPEEREDCMQAASAVIEEMREPTEAMVKAGLEANGLFDWPKTFKELNRGAAAWEAMIKEALK